MARINFESVAPNVQVKRLEEEVVTAVVQAALKEGPYHSSPILFTDEGEHLNPKRTHTYTGGDRSHHLPVQQAAFRTALRVKI